MECLICGGKKPKLILSNQIQSFRDASEQRGDGLSEKLPEGELHFTCHRSCISTYCSKHHIERCLRKRKVETCDAPPSPKKLRGKCAFNFLQDCLFCGTGCTMSRPLKNPSRWKEAYLCRTTDDGKTTSKEAILQRAHERNDAWGREVAFRANLAVSDLHAADARYHRDCLAKLFTNRPSAESSTEACDSVLEELLSQMSLDVTRIWNSAELYTLYSELGGTLISRRFLIKSVCEHFHPNLLVLTSPGVASILVFRGKAEDHLRIIDDTEDDCDAKAISKVAKKIKVECQNLKKDGLTYPSRISMNTALAECSDSLLALLSAISPQLKSTMQAAMIGNIVTSAVNFQATCLQIALSVELNQRRKLVDLFHDFGITSSYNELRRFKISCASSMVNVPSIRIV